MRVTLTVAYSWAHTRSTDPTTPSAGNPGESQGDLQVERRLGTGNDVDGGDGAAASTPLTRTVTVACFVCGHIDDDALGGVVGQVGVGSLAHAGFEGLSGGELLLQFG